MFLGGMFGLTVKGEGLIGDKMVQVHNQAKQGGKIFTFKRISVFRNTLLSVQESNAAEK